MKPDTAMLDSSQRLFAEMLDDHAAIEPFIAVVKINSRIPGRVAAHIYRNNSIGSRKSALQAIYPVTEKILGAACFGMLAEDFVKASPSLVSDLNLYGVEFADFLQQFTSTDVAFSGLPYLKDLATLEWLYHKAYYAADDLPVTANQLAEIHTSVKLERSRSLFCMRSQFPVIEIWQNHQGSRSVDEVSALTGEDFILISRQQGHPLVQLIDSEEWSILQNLEVPDVLDAVVQHALVEGIDIEQKLPAMIERGWLRLNQSG